MAPPLGAAETAAAAEKPSAPAALDPVSADPNPGDWTPSEPTMAAAVPTAACQPRDFDISSPCAAPIARPACWLISAITCGRWRWPRDSSRLRSCLARRPICGHPGRRLRVDGTVCVVDLAVGGGPTRSEARQAARAAAEAEAARPPVQAVLAAFPGAQIESIKDLVRPPATDRRRLEDDDEDSEDHDFIAEDPSAGTGF